MLTGTNHIWWHWSRMTDKCLSTNLDAHVLMLLLLVFPELVLTTFDGDVLKEVSITFASWALKAQLVKEWHHLQHH